ncbi:MAG: hypothetical protein HY582_04750, partial [Candidatus Omnitrophica bacterium]|nr:hypothetical protein [Candidatus Omnitrophota bacterium]
LELTDANNQTQVVKLGGLNGVEAKFYSNFLGRFTLDLTRITKINWVIVKEDNPTAIDGGLALRFGIFSFQESEQGPDLTKTEDDITNLPARPRVNLTGGSYPGSDVLQLSDSRVDFVYNDLSETGRFAGITLRYDDFRTPDQVETGDLSSFPELVFGFSALGTVRLKVEIEDGDTNRITIPLGSATEEEQFYVIEPGRYIGLVDFSRVRFINFIVTKETVTEEEGMLHLHTAGLFFEPRTLSEDREAKWRELIDTQTAYFTAGVGIDLDNDPTNDPDTHLPFDNIQIVNDVPQPDRRTQLTAIGFYLQMLGEMAKQLPDLRSSVLPEALTVLEQLRQYQSQLGWEGTGLLPAFINVDTAAGNEFIAFGDNANLSQSIAVLIGALSSISDFTGEEQTLADQIETLGEAALEAQGPGYVRLYDPQAHLFHGAFNTSTGQFEPYHIDKLAMEFRTGVAFVLARYRNLLPGDSEQAWFSLTQAYKDYTDQFENTIVNLVPYDGGAFQIFWPLLWSNEAKIVNVSAALQNFFYTHADYANRYQIPGFLSASYMPEETHNVSYVGALGIPEASEKNFPYNNVFDVGSLYGLASTYSLNPNLVIDWIARITIRFPQLTTPYGIVDAARSGSEYSNRLVAVDQASFILGLLGGGGDDLEKYLEDQGDLDQYRELYERLHLTISSVDKMTIGPPVQFATRSLAVLRKFVNEGVIGTDRQEQTNEYGTWIQYTNESSPFSGHFWKLSEDYDARRNRLLVVYRAVTTPRDFRIELKDANGSPLDSFTVQVPEENKLLRKDFYLSDNSNLSRVREIDFVTDPGQTNIRTASVFLHQLTFQSFDCSENPSVFCDDGNACTTDTCTATGCQNTRIEECTPCRNVDECQEDGNVCTTNTCIGGICGSENNTNPCSDGNICTENDVCSEGSCRGARIENCVPCSDSGECTSDGNACTVEVCVQGICESERIPTCV